MSSCIIFGGSGYIGTKLAEYALNRGIFSSIHIADIKKSSLINTKGIVYHPIDVRNEIPANEFDQPVKWIFNFAAIHREPGHRSEEYYETNIKGAQNVCNFATKVNCSNMFFTASISVYGPTLNATDENTLTTPNTPYGISKLTAEFIHRLWVQRESDRRLVIVRPGVIYGPGDPGNILRMIRAVKTGYFVLPVSPMIRKSYGYIYGLLESIEYMMLKQDQIITYNYVEAETESLGAMIGIINGTLGFHGKIIRLPFVMLQLAAAIIHTIKPGINGIHPERIKKLARPTHIIPGILLAEGFKFNYDFKSSLMHWKKMNPNDFK